MKVRGRRREIPLAKRVEIQYNQGEITPPPEEKRVVVHGFDAFVLDEKE